MDDDNSILAETSGTWRTQRSPYRGSLERMSDTAKPPAADRKAA